MRVKRLGMRPTVRTLNNDERSYIKCVVGRSICDAAVGASYLRPTTLYTLYTAVSGETAVRVKRLGMRPTVRTRIYVERSYLKCGLIN